MKKIDNTEFVKKYDSLYFQSLSVFGALNKSFIDHIVKNSDTLLVEPGDILFQENQYADCFYVLIDGRIFIYKGSRLHNQKTITLTKGECLGIVSMLCMQPFPGDAVSEEHTTVIRIGNELYASLPVIDGDQFSIFMMNLARNMGRVQLRTI
ncbi:MAG: cyclic nucleotide-binding domain-containing protein [Amphritea sp.]